MRYFANLLYLHSLLALFCFKCGLVDNAGVWCLSQGLPQDGVKRLLVDMEKEKGEQEEKALQAMQRSTEDMAEAEGKIQHLQVLYSRTPQLATLLTV